MSAQGQSHRFSDVHITSTNPLIANIVLQHSKRHGGPQGDIPEELNRNLLQVLGEVIQRVDELEVAALGAGLTPSLAWRSRSV